MLFRPVLYSILVHAAVAILLVFSFNFPVETIKPQRPATDIVKAVAVDEKVVEAELERLKEKEKQEQKADEQRKQELREVEQQRRAEEQRLAELKKQQQREAKEREQEQQRLKELKKQQQQLEAERKREEEKKQQAEAERKRLEEEKERIEAEKRQAEEEKKRLEEEKRREAAERKRREAEEALKKQLAEEQRQQEAAQAAADQRVINEYGRRIQEAIRRQFNITGLPDGLSCVLQIRTIPGGDVVEVRVASSSGNSIFDRRAETAVNKASPLPVPDNMRIFEKMREIRIEFDPQR